MSTNLGTAQSPPISVPSSSGKFWNLFGWKWFQTFLLQQKWNKSAKSDKNRLEKKRLVQKKNTIFCWVFFNSQKAVPLHSASVTSRGPLQPSGLQWSTSPPEGPAFGNNVSPRLGSQHLPVGVPSLNPKGWWSDTLETEPCKAPEMEGPGYHIIVLGSVSYLDPFCWSFDTKIDHFRFILKILNCKTLRHTYMYVYHFVPQHAITGIINMLRNKNTNLLKNSAKPSAKRHQLIVLELVQWP